MPFEIELSETWVGIAAESSQGPQVPLKCQGFLSSEDGEQFFEFLNNFVSARFLRQIDSKKRPEESTIDHLLAIIDQNKKCTIYVNELQFVGKVLTLESVAAGQPVYRHNVAEFVEYSPDGVELPSDRGVVFLFSAGWRKGIYFDFYPLYAQANGNPVPERNLPKVLGPFHGYLHFQDRIQISDSARNAIDKSGWFPFRGLSDSSLRSMVKTAEAGWPVDEGVLEQCLIDTKSLLPNLRQMLNDMDVFSGHRGLILKALDHFEAGDFLTSSALLYPRIEGVLRSHVEKGKVDAPKEKKDFADGALAKSVTRGRETMVSLSPLLPRRFQKFLAKRFFAGWDSNSSVTDRVSRHTVAHGVVDEKHLNEKAAIIAILTLHQIALLLPANYDREC